MPAFTPTVKNPLLSQKAGKRTKIPNMPDKRIRLSMRERGYTQVKYLLTRAEKPIVERAMSALSFEDPTNKWASMGAFTKDVIMTYCGNINKKLEGKQNNER